MQGKTADKSLNFRDILSKELESTTDYLNELTVLLNAKKLTISVIESITGGGIARKLVELPGCSNYFLGGVVAYHTRLKINYGRVQPKTIAENGVISAAVTEEMASGIKKLTNSDISIASNGIAGPKNEMFGADQSGTLFLSWCIHDKIKTKRFKLDGGRNDVIDNAVFIALSMCLRYLKNDLRKDN
ncbi:MAG: CinA family protein [Candidatus Margulisiibacteriota bacterium]